MNLKFPKIYGLIKILKIFVFDPKYIFLNFKVFPDSSSPHPRPPQISTIYSNDDLPQYDDIIALDLPSYEEATRDRMFHWIANFCIRKCLWYFYKCHDCNANSFRASTSDTLFTIFKSKTLMMQSRYSRKWVAGRYHWILFLFCFASLNIV